MDLLQTLIYTLARIGLIIMLVLFGAFVGEILFPAIASFLPYSALSFKEFLVNDTVQSVIAMLIVCIFLIWVFYDDGKRHTAYENWSSVNISIVLLIILMVYFIPAIFRDSFHAEGKADVFYMVLYYPCGWLINNLENGYLTGVLIGEMIMLLTALISYVTAYKIYVKKHPSLLVPKVPDDTDENDEENTD